MIDEKEIIKEIKKEEHKFVKNMRNNPWIFSSIILGVITLILLFNSFSGFGLTKNIISADDAGKTLIDFLSKNAPSEVTLKDVSSESGLYRVNVEYQGQPIPLYVTKDGKYFVQSVISLTGDIVPIDNSAKTNNAKPSTEITKSDKPIVEAFIFSYCPYGLQFEKALFPVYDLLKNKADFRIVAIGAMHGEYEKIETLRQISIEQLYSKDKLFEYLKEFNTNTNIGSCRGDNDCLNKYLPSIYSKLGIDKTKVESYMNTNALRIYEEQNARAKELGISGSPTFIINGVQVQVNRSPDAIREAICNTFNTKPEECSKTLSASPANPGFG